MKFLIQIVDSASVDIVDENKINSIGKGLLVYVGISVNDMTDYQMKIEKIVHKLGNTKFFHNKETDKIDLSLIDMAGEILLISNFTLYGNNKKGTKLDFSDSASFDEAKKIYNYLVDQLISKGFKLKTGCFGAMMKVNSINDGPINLVFEL